MECELIMAITNLSYDGEMWYTFDEVCDECPTVIHTKKEFKQTSNPVNNVFYQKHGSICLKCLRLTYHNPFLRGRSSIG